MQLEFYKYQGTGNDFVMVDNRKGIFDVSNIGLVKRLCDRKFGIGADGLILIDTENPALDFNMIYYNADGTKSFCGNGSRCAVEFCNFLGIIGRETKFLSTDGEHEAILNAEDEISLKMHDVENIEKGEGYYFIDTGSPHYIVEKELLDEVDVKTEGAAIRYNERFKEEGTNVNFVRYTNDSLFIRTYERGVEDETLSCGTGVTAAALSMAEKRGIKSGSIDVHTLGGKLKVTFKREEDTFKDIWLTGPALQVYQGKIEI